MLKNTKYGMVTTDHMEMEWDIVEIKIGFSRRNITPHPGVELGGYAGYRPCSGYHDPIWCKAMVLEQEDHRWALLSFDLLSIDESLSNRIAEAVTPVGIETVLCAAIHSHATPCGIVLNEGPLAEVNRVADTDPEGFSAYTEAVIENAAAACQEAVSYLESFKVRAARGPAPIIGSERHTGEIMNLTMTAVQIQTQSGRTLMLYQIPCHPTVLGPENLLVSADFVAGIEERLEADMAIFLNGAAGDISTRFTRKGQTFEECDRMADIAADALRDLIRNVPYDHPEPVKGLQAHIPLQPKPVESKENAQRAFEEAMARWKAGMDSGTEPGELRILKSYVEGAGVALEFARTMKGIERLHLPVTVFTFCGMSFATVPGEIFSSLWNLNAVPICYTNGYYRYIADRKAYELGYYETMAAILAPGQGEVFLEQINRLLKQL